jgi:iron complex transport system substrate-binding protein
MLEVDPETLFVRGHEHKSIEESEETGPAFMTAHGVAGQPTAVRNDAVYRSGPIYQGPIRNPVLTERFAIPLSPEVFPDEGLFDRERIADIIDGAF